MKFILPRRHPCGVGKWIGGSLYVHRSHVSYFKNLKSDGRRGPGWDVLYGKAAWILKSVLPFFEFDVVKLNVKERAFTFVRSPDFDSADEPVSGDSCRVDPDGEGLVSERAALTDPWIYHHKWLMVSDGYRGFDVPASKARSLAWMSLEGVDKSRIGRRSYWEREVLPRLGVDHG